MKLWVGLGNPGAKYAPSPELAFEIAHAFGKPNGEVFAWEPPEEER